MLPTIMATTLALVASNTDVLLAGVLVVFLIPLILVLSFVPLRFAHVRPRIGPALLGVSVWGILVGWGVIVCVGISLGARPGP